jgi:glycosyltransferase involved in cell wall biosynthesis
MLSWESLHSIAVGGVGVHITELAAALERKGHEVHVFTRWQAQSYVRIDGVIIIVALSTSSELRR